MADLDADGAIDVITLDAAGVVRLTSRPGESWTTRDVARWDGLTGASPASHRLIAADLDNNGALDLIASGDGASRVWLAGVDHVLQPLSVRAAGRRVFGCST